jgi:hypothetical protein
MPTNLATIIGGPCLISYAGSTFRSKGDVSLNLALDTFEIVTDLYGAVDQRVAGQPITVGFEPEGRFDDLSVLFPHASAAIGSLITPRHECGAVDTDNDTIAIAATTLAAGTPVSFGTTGTMPTGLTAATVYYLGADDEGERMVYATAAHAVAGTESEEIDLTGAGSGTLAFVVVQPLVIHGNDGTRVTLHNAAVSQMPAITFSSQATLWGPVQFEAFSKNGVAWTTANAYYTLDSAAFADEGFDPSDILTQPYTLTWGAAPWSGLSTKAGITVANTLTLEPIEDDASGVLTRRIAAVGFTATAQPMGPSLADLLTKLGIQGAGATRGRSLSGDNLNIEGTGVYARLYAAALTGGPAVWSSRLDRLGDLTWQATRTFTEGVANPLFYIGESAPA